MSGPPSASQTVGPYWHLLDEPDWADLTRGARDVAGERITLGGRIVDGAGAPVTDALVELWQAGPDGALDGAFHGWGRCATDAEGRFRFATLKPGPSRGPGNATQAPHAALTIFARGLLAQLNTRLYFAGEPLNDADPVLGAVPAARRHTLLATQTAPGAWTLDLRLQGGDETVWFAV